MKFVFKRPGVDKPYLRMTGSEAGQWEFTCDLNDATVFELSVSSDPLDRLAVLPVWPFSPRDGEQRYHVGFVIAPVRVDLRKEL